MRKVNLWIVSLLLSASVNTAVYAQTDDQKVTVTTKTGENEDIDLPEGMTINSDSLLDLYQTKQYLKRNVECNLPDVNPVFEREVYIDRLKRLPTVIEMPYNDVVRKFIDKYSGQLRRKVSYMLGASNFYMPIFEEALEAYNLPLELKYLPVIESALNPKAVSRVGATGLWQFMLPTGKRYGLEVNSMVDERCDIVKSSYAAAHYLSDLYKIFRDWNLVIAAYNAGPGNINKAIHRANGSTDYWTIYPYLPRETRGYVPAFIAANYIMNYYCEHNICPMTAELPIKTDTVIVDKNVHFEQIARVLGVETDLIKTLNPQYRQNIVAGYTSPSSLRLPANLVSAYIDHEDSILAYQPDVFLPKRSEVEIESNTAQYDSGKRSSYSSRKYARRGKSSSRRSNRRNRSGKNVNVRSGDTLSEIAARNGTTVKKLRKLNKIKGNTIRPGQKIRVK